MVPMKENRKRKLPLDFKVWAVLPVYLVLIALVILFGMSFGARWSWMIGAFMLGLLTGLPAAKWELTAINESWNEIISGPIISFRVAYFKKPGAKRRTRYFIGAAIVIPVVYILSSYVFYWYRFLAEMGTRSSIYLLFRWNGWYWLPFIFGLSFTSTGLPRLAAAAGFKHRHLAESGGGNK